MLVAADQNWFLEITKKYLLFQTRHWENKNVNQVHLLLWNKMLSSSMVGEKKQVIPQGSASK